MSLKSVNKANECVFPFTFFSAALFVVVDYVFDLIILSLCAVGLSCVPFFLFSAFFFFYYIFFSVFYVSTLVSYDMERMKASCSQFLYVIRLRYSSRFPSNNNLILIYSPKKVQCHLAECIVLSNSIYTRWGSYHVPTSIKDTLSHQEGKP